MWYSRVLLVGAAMLGLVLPAPLCAQFVDSGTFIGTQTLGNQGNTGPQGNPGQTGGTGGTGNKGTGGAGGAGGYYSYNYHFFCSFEPPVGAAPGPSGGRGGNGGPGGSGGQGGQGGPGGGGGIATWSFAGGSSFTNNSVVNIGGVPGTPGAAGSSGLTGASGGTGSSGRTGGGGGSGGFLVAPPLFGIGFPGAAGEGTNPGGGGWGGLAGLNGFGGGFGGPPDGGGGGGGGGGACSFGFIGNGGPGGAGYGGNGAPGIAGAPGIGGLPGSPGSPGSAIPHSTTGSFTNNGTITIGGEGGTGGTGGNGGNGGNGNRSGDGGDGGGAGGSAGNVSTNVGAGAPGGAPGSSGGGGAEGAGGPGGSGGGGGAATIEILAGASVLNSSVGTITVRANGTLTNHAGGTLNNDGTIDASAISNWTNGGTLSGTGVITGAFINEGIFAPGGSAGVHTINGDYTEQGTLKIEIGGLIAGTEYDFVDVIGSNRTVNLDSALSTLEISFVGGFDARVLMVGDEFDIIRYTGPLQGTFGSVVQPLASPVLFEVDHTDDGSVTLRVVAELPGNCAGTPAINLEDYAPFSGCMAGPEGGSDPGCTCADIDRDGDVDLRDYSEFLLRFGS